MERAFDHLDERSIRNIERAFDYKKVLSEYSRVTQSTDTQKNGSRKGVHIYGGAPEKAAGFFTGNR